jgi:hypothetical protein
MTTATAPLEESLITDAVFGELSDEPIPFTLAITDGGRYRLFVEWESHRGHRPLPGLSADDEGTAIAMAKLASKFLNVRYAAVYLTGNAYPVALAVRGHDVDWDLDTALAFMS